MSIVFTAPSFGSLYVGCKFAADQVGLLRGNEIGHRVTAVEYHIPVPCEGVADYDAPMESAFTGEMGIEKFIQQCFRVVTRLRQCNTLVYCWTGSHRSCLLVTGSLMLLTGQTALKCIEHVHACRRLSDFWSRHDKGWTGLEILRWAEPRMQWYAREPSSMSVVVACR